MLQDLYEIIIKDFPGLRRDDEGVYKIYLVLNDLKSIRDNEIYTPKIREKARVLLYAVPEKDN